MPNHDIEQQIRMAHYGFGITIAMFNDMNIYDKSHFFLRKGLPISGRYVGKTFLQIKKVGDFYVELKTTNGKDREYKAAEKLEQLQAPKASVKKASPTEDDLDKKIIANFKKQQQAYTNRWANRSTMDYDDDLPF